MRVTAIKTERVDAGYGPVEKFLDSNLSHLHEKDVLVITSKVVAICEGRIVAAESADKNELVSREADYVLPEKFIDEHIQMAIKGNTLIPAAGIDQSNSNGDFVLWPSDVRRSANDIRKYLRRRFRLAEIGVLITDSGTLPLHFGTIGTAIAYSGFSPFKDYTGQTDLYGYRLKAGRANLADGLAAAAVVEMGEGTEQTPMAIISGVTGIKFCDSDPSDDELASFYLDYDSDRLFAPFLQNINWQTGGAPGEI